MKEILTQKTPEQTESHPKRADFRGSGLIRFFSFCFFSVGFFGSGISLLAAFGAGSETSIATIFVCFLLCVLLMAITVVNEVLLLIAKAINDRPRVSDLPNPLPVVAVKLPVSTKQLVMFACVSFSGLAAIASEPADVVVLRDGSSVECVVKAYKPPNYTVAEINSDGSVGSERQIRVIEIASISFHQQLQANHGSLAVELGVDSPSDPRNELEAWKFPDRVSVRSGMPFIAKVLGIIENQLWFEVPSGVVHKIPVQEITITKIASREELVNALSAAMEKEKVQAAESENAKEVNAKPFSEYGELAFWISGTGSRSSNSQPFIIGEPALYVAGIKPNGTAPYASIMVDGLGDSDVIGGNAATNDVDDEGPHVVAKIIYDRGDGRCYADVSAQGGEWFLAIISLKHIPSERGVDAICKKLLAKAGWSTRTKIYQ